MEAVIQARAGTHVNISGGGVAAHAKHEKNAIEFLRFLSSDASQAAFADGNMEYPVKPGVAVHPIIAALGPLKVDGLSLADVARHRAAASKLVDKVGFDR